MFINFAPHCSYPPFCFQVGTTNRYIRVFLQSKFYVAPAKSSVVLDLLCLESKSPWRQLSANSTNCFIYPATLQVTQQVSFLLTWMCRSLMLPLLIVAVLHWSAYENINIHPKCNQMALHQSRKQTEELMVCRCRRSGYFFTALTLRCLYMTSRVQDDISPQE